MITNKIPYTPTAKDIVIGLVEKTETGLFLPEGSVKTAVEDDNAVEVLAVGPECQQVKVGDKVFLREVQPTLIMINGKKYLQLREYDCLGVLHQLVN